MFANSRDFVVIISKEFVARPYRVMLAGSMLLVSAIALTVLPVMTSGVIEEWTRAEPQNLNPFDPALLGVVGTFVLWLTSSSINDYIQEESNQRTVLHSRLELCRRWLRRAPTADDAQFALVTRITSDAEAFERALAAVSHHVPLATVQIVGALVAMIVVAPLLGLFFIICLFVIAGMLSFVEQRLVALSRGVNEAAEIAMSRSIELLTHNRLIRRFRQEQGECARVEDAQSRLMNALERRRKRQLIARAIVFLALASSIASIALMGLARVSAGSALPGDLIAFVGLALIVGTSVISLTDSLAAIAGGVEPLRRLTERFATAPSPERRRALSMTRGPSLKIDGLRFSYDSKANGFLLAVDGVEIRSGSTVAFVGASGCGKSTLLRLIGGEEAVPDNSIFLDGCDVNHIDSDTLCANVAYFDPTAPILARSVSENIIFGRANSQKTFDHAVAAAFAADLLERGGDGRSFPEGLSSGQRQRIALARSLMSEAPLLLLDEATSAIDSHQERNIIDAISARYPDTTTIIVSHRLSAVRHAEQIFVFSGGSIVEAGNHDQLAKKGNVYKALFFDQLSIDQRQS